MKAKDLRSGDALLLLDGRTMTIQSIAVKHLKESITVDNFEVEGFHTYFVGSFGVLAHNVCFSYSDLRAIANTDKHKTISYADAMAYGELAYAYGVDYHPPMTHPNRGGYWANIYHISVAGVHIRVQR